MSFKEKIKSHKHLLINILIALVFFAAGYVYCVKYPTRGSGKWQFYEK